MRTAAVALPTVTEVVVAVVPIDKAPAVILVKDPRILITPVFDMLIPVVAPAFPVLNAIESPAAAPLLVDWRVNVALAAVPPITDGEITLVAVIAPAAKAPPASLATIADAVFADVAVVAELDTLPAVEIVASFVSTIAAAASTSALTMKEEERSPPAALWTMPAVVNFGKKTPVNPPLFLPSTIEEAMLVPMLNGMAGEVSMPLALQLMPAPK